MFRYFKTDNTWTNHSKKVIREGMDVLFKCSSASKAEWYFKDDNLPSNTRIFNDSTLVIYNTSTLNGGFYTCVGTTEDFYTFYADVSLQVFGNSLL